MNTVRRLLPDTSVVVVIDIQDKLLAKVPAAAALVRNAGFVLDAAALLGVPSSTRRGWAGPPPTSPGGSRPRRPRRRRSAAAGRARSWKS